VEPALRNGEGTVIFREDIALAKGRAEGKGVLRGFRVGIGKIEVIYWVQPGRVGGGMMAQVVRRVVMMGRKDEASEQKDGKKEGEDEPDAIWQTERALVQSRRELIRGGENRRGRYAGRRRRYIRGTLG
jgi:hypothetical protein